jgi:hypothetical protein
LRSLAERPQFCKRDGSGAVELVERGVAIDFRLADVAREVVAGEERHRDAEPTEFTGLVPGKCSYWAPSVTSRVRCARGEVAQALGRLDARLRGLHVGARFHRLGEHRGIGALRRRPRVRGGQLGGRGFLADEIRQRELRPGEVGARRPGIVLRSSLVHFHLRHVGRREVAGLQARLGRLERAAEECGGLVQHLRRSCACLRSK